MPHYNALRGPWLTPGIAERLIELHAASAGLSMLDIARVLNREFGVGTTRNAVIGKTRRLNLPLREPGVMPWGKKRQVKPRQPKARKRRPIAPKPPVPQLDPPPRALTLIELSDGVCHFPLGETFARPPYLYCGKQAAFEGCFWCADHYEVTHVVTRERA